MATALDLLMSEKEDVNLHSEESDICTIDAKTRAIFVPSTIVVGGVQSDKNAERIKFSCPKIVGDNLDLSKFSVRINFENVSSVDFNVSIKDQYICDDVAVDGENVTFSWLIGRNAARYMGTVRFIVCAVKTDSDSNISVEWNTAIAEVPVLEGIEIDQPQIGQEEKDVINQLLELTKNTSAEAVQNVNSAKEQAIKDIQSVSQPDTTLTIEGGLAEAKATGEAIGSLKEDLDDLVKFVNYEEIVISNNLISGKSIYTVDGTNYNGASSWKRMKYVVEVDEGDIITYTGYAFSNCGGVVVYDANGEFLTALIKNTSSTERFYNKEEVIIPTNGKYVICADSNQTSTNQTLVTLKRKVKKETDKMTYLYVSSIAKAYDAIGTKGIPFASIKDANDYITENSKDNPFTIIVKNGTYTDLQSFYSGKDGTYESGAYQGVNCKDYVYYESENINNPQDCIIQWDGLAGFTSPVSYDDVFFYKCPFHLCSVHTHIKGFKFVCKNLRYCLHVESSGYGKKAKWEISNCIFDWLNCPDQIGNPDTPTIGMGVSHFEEGYIHDCIFINSLPTYNGSGIMVHDSRWASEYIPYMYKGAIIKLENNDFGNNGITVRTMIDDSYYNTKNIIEINGCNHISIFAHVFLNDKTVKEWNAVIIGSDIVDNQFDN